MENSRGKLVVDLPYRPQNPKKYQPSIAMIGCGGIAKHHLQAYKNADYRVTALCDLDLQRAAKLQADFFPEAETSNDYHQVLADDSIEVVDIATHPRERTPIVEAALKAGKHVLSQKPFVTDLDEGERLVELANHNSVRLAVNQNGRWAPHFSYMRQAVAQGLLGELMAAHFAVHWDHSWVKGTEFEKIEHLILYDFAIHWFDLLAELFASREPLRVYASVTRSGTQEIAPNLLGQAMVEFDQAQATLVFDGHTTAGDLDTTFLAGSDASLHSEGEDINSQAVTLSTPLGRWSPNLEGRWFDDGFHGAMGELLVAIEEGREPVHSARNNLKSLALCFAAVASAERNEPVVPGTVRQLPG